MSKTILTFLLLACFLHVQCQTLQDLGVLYGKGLFPEALIMAEKLEKDPATSAGADEIIGRIYVNQGKYATAISYLKKAIKQDNERSDISGWSYVYLGKAHLLMGQKEKGMAELNKAIELHKTNNSVRYAQHILEVVKEQQESGNAALEPKWVTIKGNRILYKFQDTTGWGKKVKQYIDEHEAAYIKINKTFHATLAQKPTFYVWNDRVLAKKVLGQDLGFTNPELYKCNVSYDQTIGHELTHVLSYWGWGTRIAPGKMTPFIMEGVAVAFDQERNDKYETAKRAALGKDVHSVLDVWKSGRRTNEGLLYPLSGAFVTYLYQKSTPEQFKRIIKDQTIESAEEIYGVVQFDVMVKEFNNMIGLS